jgi:hypothetical protein
MTTSRDTCDTNRQTQQRQTETDRQTCRQTGIWMGREEAVAYDDGGMRVHVEVGITRVHHDRVDDSARRQVAIAVAVLLARRQEHGVMTLLHVQKGDQRLVVGLRSCDGGGRRWGKIYPSDS